MYLFAHIHLTYEGSCIRLNRVYDTNSAHVVIMTPWHDQCIALIIHLLSLNYIQFD